MVDKIEMSLDEIIKSQKSSRPRGGGRSGGAGRGNRRAGASGSANARNGFRAGQRNGGASGGGGVLKGRTRGGISRARYGRGDVNSAWKHDMYEGPRKNRLLATAGIGGLGGGPGGAAKLLVSNLDFGVSETDINELFAEFGPLRSASVHYDRSGRSLGTADVVFERRSDAIKAMKQYNGVPLDGRPMSIQMATSEIPAPRVPRPAALAAASSSRSPRKPTGGRGGASAAGKSQGRGGRGGGSGGRRQPRETKTAEELDAELDAYTKDMK
uniref:Uncharacterized protein n=1 Tax=Anopheles stephensi TaxID=30069 RepID=A0A182YNL2_ANOST